ncbi:MAG: hypothetical protein HZA93_29805, partial [Verrucomicrobia bacterium]|nr:hypothetical protein [Verrucomicrobiota bacterium]
MNQFSLTLRCLAFAGMLLGLSARAGAATNVGGPILSDTSWLRSAGPFVVTADVQVAPGVTLTIEAGAVVQFNGAFQILVKGVLLANGTSASPILFGATIAGISSGATMLKFEGTNLAASQLSYLQFADAARAILVGGGGGEFNPGLP